MAIKFDCPKCGKKIGVPESAAGKQGKCPGCGTALVVPKTPAPPAARPDRQGGTDYNFRLSDEDRQRIEEEEQFRAEARARAERQVRAKETPPYAEPTPAARSRVVTFACPLCFSEITAAVSGDVAYSREVTTCSSCRQEVSVPSKSTSAPARPRLTAVQSGGVQADEDPRGKVLTELTSKRLKLQTIYAALTTGLGTVIVCSGLGSEGTGGRGLALLGGVLFVGGLLWSATVRIWIWWEHG